MAYLNFISDNDLSKCFKHLHESTAKGSEKADDKFERNVIDPFSTLIEMAIFGCDSKTWTTMEKRRQSQKSLTNAIGTFHQQILACIQGWEDLGTSNQVDLVNRERKIIAEIKNKHNTLKASDKAMLYRRLSDLIFKKNSIFKGFTAYYVEIVPDSSKSYDIPFVPSDSSTGGRCPVDKKIRKIDGRSFYALATGDENALDNLFTVLPDVMEPFVRKLESRDVVFAVDYFKKAYRH